MLTALSQMLTYPFMVRALLAVLLIMPLFSLLGTLVVNRRMSFFSDALGHSALTGVALGVLLGMADPTPVMLLFAAVFAVGLNAIRRSRLSSTDTVIGVFSACGVALGLTLLSRLGFSSYQSLLIGDIVSVTEGQLWVLFGTLIGVVLV